MESLDKYRIFYEVAKEKNISKASEKLFISQPAVSQTIKKLEEELDVTLFIRGKKGVELTKIGNEIFQRVEVAILALNSVDRLVDEENELLKGELTIGAGSNVAREVLVSPIKKFLEVFPNVNVTQIEGVQSDMIEMLKKGQADIIITQNNSEISGFFFQPIMEQSYFFIKRKNKEIKRFISTSKGSYSRMLFEEFAKTRNFEKIPYLTVSGHRMAMELAKAGVGVALVPELMAKDLLEEGKVEKCFTDYSLPVVTFGYYFNPDIASATTKMFLKFLSKND